MCVCPTLNLVGFERKFAGCDTVFFVGRYSKRGLLLGVVVLRVALFKFC